jgi:hypothetical protein
LVFVGVYAAFWLNTYQQHQQEAKRRDQILASLEQQLKDGIDSAKSEGAREEKLVAVFHRALAAGEMPPLPTFNFSSITAPAISQLCCNRAESNCSTCKPSPRSAILNRSSAEAWPE